MRNAIIDLGTNTFNLLIFEKQGSGFKTVFSHKEGVALGMGGINDNYISPDAFERGVQTLEQFQYICNQHQVKLIRAFGTSALRAAENQADFVEAVMSMTGIPVTVIDGDTEAELIYQGVLTSHTFSENTMILDIGGGSSEFIFANETEVIKAQSFEIGVSRIFQQGDFSDPFTERDIDRIVDYLEQKTKGFFKDIETNVLVGASGSFETFYEIINEIDFPKGNQSKTVPFDRFIDCLDDIIYSSLLERKANNRIIPIRKIMAPFAAVKIKWLIDKLGINEVHISPNSLKEGAMEVLF